MTGNGLSDMTGKTVLITGATNGIGKAAADALAHLGATVIVVGRSRDKTQAVADAINARGRGRAEIAVADLSIMAQVRALAAEIQARYTRLDVLVNNAGAFFTTRTVTGDGFEMTFALNHLNYFLLTHELLPLLTRSTPARIISVASDAHQAGTINFDNLQSETGFLGFRVYSNSKLANIVFTYELARRLKEQGAGVTANVMHPGFVGTGFSTNNGALYRIGMMFLRPFIRTPEQGADTIVWLASAPEMAGQSGGYYFNRRPTASNAQSKDTAVQRRLWEVTESLLKA
ncbi:MAG: SDR family oxidoreductase [Chloroflexota bacterium]|nr:SDR family oxidoreductase [Chloroflexota bacterium]